MVIMGGGYDNCEDVDPVADACKSGGKGHRIYVLDAADGTSSRNSRPTAA
jgi:type IV pilus assembly protein PilY1